MFQSQTDPKLKNNRTNISNPSSDQSNLHNNKSHNLSINNLNSSINNLQFSFAPSIKNWDLKINQTKTSKQCFLGKERYKGIIFLFGLTIKFIISLILVIDWKPYLLIIEILLFVVSFILCMVCIFSNPGVVPRNNNMLYNYKNTLIVLRGRLFKSKICKTCLIARPIGTSHCKKCNNCVNKLDHHCNWIGNCIGIQNYRYFFYFINFLNIYLLFSLITGICLSVHQSPNLYKVFSIIISLVSFLSGLFVFSLVIAHTYYIYLGQPTYMRIKYKKYMKISGNLFNKGWYVNLKRIFCWSYVILTNNNSSNQSIKVNQFLNSLYHNNTGPSTQGGDIIKQLNPLNQSNIYVNCYINNTETNINPNLGFHPKRKHSHHSHHSNNQILYRERINNSFFHFKTTNFINFSFKKTFEEDKSSSCHVNHTLNGYKKINKSLGSDNSSIIFTNHAKIDNSINPLNTINNESIL